MKPEALRGIRWQIYSEVAGIFCYILFSSSRKRYQSLPDSLIRVPIHNDSRNIWFTYLGLGVRSAQSNKPTKLRHFKPCGYCP